MSANHKIHYHEKDGDIFLKAENTIFLIHKTFLSLSSEFFKDLFKLAKPSSNENVNIIDGTTIEMNGETSESIERMLSFIYPNTFVEITWDNVEDLLRISNKFIISKLTKSCSVFLLHHFQENFLLSFTLADKYSFPKVFKESSKLLLDDFQKYRSDPTYDELSQRAKLKLTDAWYHYTNSLHIYFGKNSKSSARISDKVITFSEFLLSESLNFFLKPSKFSKFYRDWKLKLPTYRNSITIEELFKNYETLEFQSIQLNEANKSNKTQYIFIELEN
ncbi:5906_t:CDS:1 [Funneliformis mosseae]|uniref:5906_t:CDS:1 n=1 Tax=Funneliformis mosseae TaxID=27381 RepID=A0A9N9BGL2_FUNMO|nr:5906_t:CDS:1 [Funneliformis mosseae]